MTKTKNFLACQLESSGGRQIDMAIARTESTARLRSLSESCSEKPKKKTVRQDTKGESKARSRDVCFISGTVWDENQ